MQHGDLWTWEGELSVTREALGLFLTSLRQRLDELSAEQLRRMLLEYCARLPAEERVGFRRVLAPLTP